MPALYRCKFVIDGLMKLFFSYFLFLCQIQRNLQLRIEEQGRYLQMMFEQQCKSDTYKKAPSTPAIENPSVVPSDAIKDCPANDEVEASQAEGNCKSGRDQANSSSVVEGSSVEVGMKNDGPENQVNSGSDPSSKRKRTEE